MNDDLFQPSLQADAVPVYDKKPWSNYAQFVVAFFGGTLSIAVFSLQNSTRLQLGERDRRHVRWLGIGGVALSVVATVLFALYVTDPLERNNMRIMRYLNRGLAVIVAYVIYRFQRSSYRVYQYSTDGDYDSPWGPGLLAVFLWGTVQGIVLGLMYAAISGSLEEMLTP